MQWDSVKGCVTEIGWVLVIENRLAGRIQAQELGILALGCQAANDRVIDEVIQWRVFIDTAADRTEDTLVHLIVPNFRGHFCVQIQLILSRTGKVALLSW